MPNTFSRNALKINDIFTKFRNEEWVVDPSYQRRKVWGIKDNVRLIETILLDLVIPEIFVWDCETNPNTGVTITHIVDGQQRVNAIFDFISDKYKLQSKFLLNERIKEACGDQTFSQLDDAVKKKIWTYEISVVNLANSFVIEDIHNMFYRLNLTDYSLNDQEKRNSLDSEFGRVAEELANCDFWANYKVFSPKDIRRMGDVEYCSSILVLCREGIVDQTKQDKLNEVYKDYAEEYKDADVDIQKVKDAMEMLSSLVSEETLSFASKKIQMYTLFSLAFDFIDSQIQINEDIKNLFVQFVKAYDAFSNEFDLEFETEGEKKSFELIKKYKLASSEGVNKLVNRMIRFEVLKKVLLQIEKISIEDLKTVETIYIQKKEEE